MGASIRREGDVLIISPVERLEAGDVPVPGDFSSAAFFIAGALLVPGSDVSLREVGINRNRIGLLSILSRMGVEMGGAHEGGRAMTVHEIREPGPEPIATLQVRSATLRGAEITAADVPAAIDELPLLALLACFAEGETVVGGAAELRAKESDRISGVVDGLSGLGADIEARPDGFAVRGAGCGEGGSRPAAITAWRWSERSRALPLMRGSRSTASSRSASATRASSEICGR
jgi:3-phosphoshikimate 1-carboxyvinyltransferase